MPMPDVQILNQSEDARYNQAGEALRYIRVSFMVGKHGPFTVRIDKDGFTAAKRDEAIEVLAREVRT